jgi:formylglycine-generating enzyme required for sulfatase activity
MLFATANVGCNKDPQSSAGLPPELTIDLGGGMQLEMVLIPTGRFLMGAPDSDKDTEADENPIHRVWITKPFYLGKYEVTQEQWEAVTGDNPSYFKGSRRPVEMVSWKDCQQFLNKLNRQPGHRAGKFRLPTEAEWEYACRARTTTRFYFGDDERELGQYAWYDKNSRSQTHPVGGKIPNAWGLYDMHGNVIEWCADWYCDEYYTHSPTDNPLGPVKGENYVLRGGSWGFPSAYCRSASRNSHELEARRYYLGLRLALDPADR